MATMFPSLYRGDNNDPNRRVLRWEPGNPIPRLVTFAYASYFLVGVMMLVTGIPMLNAHWDHQPVDAQELERMEFVRKNLRILGIVNIVLGSAITIMAHRVYSGSRTGRRIMLALSVLACFFLLAGWVFHFTGPGQGLFALVLVITGLAVFRPYNDTYFSAQGNGIAQARSAQKDSARKNKAQDN